MENTCSNITAMLQLSTSD